MAIRERLRRTFRSKKNASGGNAEPDDGYPPRRKDIEYYKPHEIPKSKYKGKVDPVHQERLEAYSFAQAFQSTRRTSIAMSGTFSPGGTQAMSAAQSRVQSRRSSWTSREPSSTGSAESHATSATSAGSIYQQMASIAFTGQPKQAKLEETDHNVPSQINTELSRTVTATDKPPTEEDEDEDSAELCVEKTMTNGRPPSTPPQNRPFSADDLEKAMAKATLRPRRGTVIGNLEEVVVP